VQVNCHEAYVNVVSGDVDVAVVCCLLFVGVWSCCYCCGHGKVSVVRRHCHCRCHCGCQVVVVMLFELLTGLMLERQLSSQQWHWTTTVPTTIRNNQMVSRSVEQAISKPEADMLMNAHNCGCGDVRCRCVVLLCCCVVVVVVFIVVQTSQVTAMLHLICINAVSFHS
jgi:hypothetical protein